jgi:hypothetical protein
MARRTVPKGEPLAPADHAVVELFREIVWASEGRDRRLERLCWRDLIAYLEDDLRHCRREQL